MSIEAKIDQLIEALNANTKALGAAPAASTGKAGDTGTTRGRGKAAKTSSVTMEEVQTTLQNLAEKTSPQDAKDIIKNVGGVVKMAEIPVDKLDAVHAAALAKIEEAEAGGDEL